MPFIENADYDDLPKCACTFGIIASKEKNEEVTQLLNFYKGMQLGNDLNIVVCDSLQQLSMETILDLRFLIVFTIPPHEELQFIRSVIGTRFMIYLINKD